MPSLSQIGEMDGVMCLANYSSFKTMHDFGKLISFTLFWERKRTKDTSTILWIKIWTKIWWETGEDDQVGQKKSGGIKNQRICNKKNDELKSE